MRKSIFAIIVAAASTLVFAGADIDISVLDTNQDGLISLVEAQKDTKLAEKFSSLDTNQDGFLSKEELAVKSELPSQE